MNIFVIVVNLGKLSRLPPSRSENSSFDIFFK